MNRNFRDSFINAVDGLKTAYKDERNFRIEIYLATITLLLSFLLRISVLELTAIVFCVVMVLVAELFNSALEHLVDLFSPEYHELARKAKDIGAAAVLTISFGSAIIGVLIFLPKILELFN